MNFFEAQDRARQRTVWMVCLFVLAVAGLIGGLYFAFHFYLHGGAPTGVETIDKELLINSVLGVLAVVSVGTIYKTYVLSVGGGVAVAESMGGRLVSPATDNADEKRLLNIVAEMALAAGTPVPPVFLMPESGINAFAAGTTVSNAVIGVTQGALTAFDRDQMQGVIAHEFSHIINGDMRLNLRLMGVIHGIMLLGFIGYFLLRSSFYSRRSSSSQQNPLPLIGIALIIVGFVGTFFGNWIRAGVSRQREFLADASAVQFTRNPLGIGGALQKIGIEAGLLDNPKAAECAHLFFASGIAQGLSSPFASHPPIQERIKKILPQWDGKLSVSPAATDAVANDGAASAFSAGGTGGASVGMASGLALAASGGGQPPDLFNTLFGGSGSNILPAISPAAISSAQNFIRKLPLEVRQAAEDSYSARALLYTILLARNNEDCRKRQLEQLRKFADPGVYEMVLHLFPHIISLSRPACLSLAHRDLPALRLLSPAQYQKFIQNMDALVAADSTIDLFEWSVQAIVVHSLADCFGKRPAAKLDGGTFGSHAAYALSILANAGHHDKALAEDVFEKSQENMPTQIAFDPSPFNPQKLFSTLQNLSKEKPRKKEKLMKAIISCVEHDNDINDDEAALVRAYAALLDSPLPADFGLAQRT